MRDQFHGFYAPTEEEYQKLWNDAAIVVDTNVLLSLYRLPKTARDEFLSVLTDLKTRIWIPYQVALEFQRARLSVIANERKTTETALQASGDVVQQIKDKVRRLQIDKHGLGFEAEPLLVDLESANQKLCEAITAVHNAQLEITATDPIREQVDKLIGDQVGDPPKTQDELDHLIKDGDVRYDAKIPPGYADSDKDKNPNAAAYVHDGLTYQRKFGDLVVWRQLLNHSKKKKLKTVMFVTSDKKDDWWWREQGKTMGPQPELVREIRRESGVELFWMYSSSQFLEHAKKYKQAEVSDKSVADLKNFVRFKLLPSVEGEAERDAFRSSELREGNPYISASRKTASLLEARVAEGAVKQWLQETLGGEIISQDAFPDILRVMEDDITGYEVKYTKKPVTFFNSIGAIGSLSRGYVELNEERLSQFYLVIVIEASALDEFSEGSGFQFLQERAAMALSQFPISGILIGTLTELGNFELIGRQFR